MVDFWTWLICVIPFSPGKEIKTFLEQLRWDFPLEKLQLNRLCCIYFPNHRICFVWFLMQAQYSMSAKRIIEGDMEQLRAVLQGKDGTAMWAALGRMKLSPNDKVSSHT